MCEIFGVSSLNDFTANDYLRTFYSHSDFHPHGWGLACISRNGALVEKESIKALSSNYLRERLSQPITAKIPRTYPLRYNRKCGVQELPPLYG